MGFVLTMGENGSDYKSEVAQLLVKKINLTLLMIHFILMIIFQITNLSIMMFINIFSVLIYLYSFEYIRKKLFGKYILVIYFEVWIHMIIASFVLGWDCGFYLYSFPLMVGIFYSVYLGKIIQISYRRSIILSIMSAIVFSIIRVITYFSTPFYKLDIHILFLFFWANVIIDFAFIILFMIDFVKTAVKSESILQGLAMQDELTGLYNRHMMKAILEVTYENSNKQNTNFFVAILDIDDFKNVNDTYGHNGGDYVLQQIGKIMRKATELDTLNTIVCRWGGEEFLILQKKYDYKNSYDQIINISNIISETTFLFENKEISVTVSGGFSQYKREYSIDDIIRIADTNLYKAKERGKNCIVG